MDIKSTEEDFKLEKRAYAIIPAVICPFAFLFQFGFNIGSLNSIRTELQSFYNSSYQNRFNETITHSNLHVLWSLTTSSFSIGGAVGTFFANPFISRFGQLRTMLFVQCFCFVGTSFLVMSYFFQLYEFLIVGEMLNGMYSSIGSIVALIYVRDITVPRLRGTVGGLFGVFLVLGIIFGNTIGLKEMLGTSTNWPYLLAITAIPNLVFISYYRWMPRNPRYVYHKTRNEEAVLKLLEKLFGSEQLHVFMDEYKAEMTIRQKNMSLYQILTTHHTRWQLLSAVIVLSSIQITGINGVMYNLNNILAAAGVESEITPYISISVAVLQLIGSVTAATFVAPRCGRKTTFFFGNTLVALSCLVYTVSVALQQSVTWAPYVSIIATMTYGVGLNTGSSVIAFVLGPEILSQSARAIGMSVAVFFLWFSFALVSFVTPYFFDNLGFAAMLPYLTIAILILIYVYLFIPETKHLSPSEVDEFFKRRGQRCGRKVNVMEEMDDSRVTNRILLEPLS